MSTASDRPPEHVTSTPAGFWDDGVFYPYALRRPPSEPPHGFWDEHGTFYPWDDGEPMVENTEQYRWLTVIKDGIEALFADDPQVFVAGDLLWYSVKSRPPAGLAPDVMVVFGRHKGRRNVYTQWEEGDVAAQVVFEILSPSNRRREMDRKRGWYEAAGTEEYYEYDPDEGTFEAWIRPRRGGKLRKLKSADGYTSPRLGVTFENASGGPSSLVIRRPDGESFQTFVEIRAERDQERRLRRQAEQRAAELAQHRQDAEQKAAAEARLRLEAEQKAERLAARLRELGLDDA